MNGCLQLTNLELLSAQHCLTLEKRLILLTNDHNILANKVVSLDLSAPTKNWILDFLIDRKQCVTLRNGGMSEWSNIRAGVPQGTKLSQWLYVLMINDLSSSTNEVCKFVDDTSLSEKITYGDVSQPHPVICRSP